MFQGILLSVLFFITNGKNEFMPDRFKENIKFYKRFMLTCRTPGKLSFEGVFNSQKFIVKILTKRDKQGDRAEKDSVFKKRMLVDCVPNPLV